MNTTAPSVESLAAQLIKESFGSTRTYPKTDQQEFTPTDIAFKIFPYLIDVYEQATVATETRSRKYRRSNDVLGAHLKTEVLPELKTPCTERELDGILSEVYSAYPEVKAIVKNSERDFPGGTNDGGTIYAIIGTLVAAVCVYAVGYAIGYALS